jgi:hypothetical protein
MRACMRASRHTRPHTGVSGHGVFSLVPSSSSRPRSRFRRRPLRSQGAARDGPGDGFDLAV